MKLSEIKNKKHMDLIIPISIAVVCVVLASYIGVICINNFSVVKVVYDKLYSILSPFIYALIVAYILNPIMKFFEKKLKLNRGISILLTYAAIVSLLLLIIIYLAPRVVDSLVDISDNIPYFTNKAQIWLNEMINKYGISGMDIKPDMLITKVSGVALTLLNSLLANMFSFTGYLIKWVFAFLIAIYVLFDKEKFINLGKNIIFKIFKNRIGGKILKVLKTLNIMIGTYIGIKAVDSLIIGTIALIGLTIFGSPYALLIALIVGVTNMIPYFGPFIGIVAGFLINVFFNPMKAFFIMIFLFLLQQFDAWYLDPKLIGGKVGLSPFLVIFAVTLGGGFYGAIGMILSVPVMAVVKTYIDKFKLAQ